MHEQNHFGKAISAVFQVFQRLLPPENHVAAATTTDVPASGSAHLAIKRPLLIALKFSLEAISAPYRPARITATIDETPQTGDPLTCAYPLSSS